MAQSASGRDAQGQDTKEETQALADAIAGAVALVLGIVGVAIARSLGLF